MWNEIVPQFLLSIQKTNSSEQAYMFGKHLEKSSVIPAALNVIEQRTGL